MSEDIGKSELVGVRFPRRMLDKIDERRAVTGESRQDIIKQVVVEQLFQGCY